MWQKTNRADQARQVAGDIPIHHRYTAGVAGERFFRALGDERRIMASKCPSCGNSFLPPRMYCEECFVGTKDWVEVEGAGRVETFTLMHVDMDGLPLDPPEAVGLISWEGISGGLVHRIALDGPAQITIGMAVVPVWAADPIGAITDIVCFRPA